MNIFANFFKPLILITLILTLGLIPVFSANASIQPRIVGGVESASGDWLFMAGLVPKDLAVIANGESYRADFMNGAPNEQFSGKLVNCQQAFITCENVSGHICLIERGVNFFYEKAASCERGGGIGAIIYNNETGPYFGTLGLDGGDIPVVSIDHDAGLALLNLLQQDIAVAYIDSVADSSFCGASYIGGKWLVTAAHCVDGAQAENLSVNVGGHNLVTDQDNVITVARIISHENYDPLNIVNDIALLELVDEPIGVNPVKLADEEMLLAAIDIAQNATALGRGHQNAVRPNELPASDDIKAVYEVQLPLLSNNTCNAALNQYFASIGQTDSNPITQEMLCAGPEQGNVGTCFGDSGGPLLIEIQGEFYLTGITSWGIGCAQPNVYEAYTRVPYFKNRIEAIVSGESDSFIATENNPVEDGNPAEGDIPGTDTPQNDIPTEQKKSDKEWYNAWSAPASLLTILLLLISRGKLLQKLVKLRS